MPGNSQMAILSRLMDVAALRQRIHGENLNNQNVPGYRARAVAFEDAFREALESGDDPTTVQATIYEPRNTPPQNDGNDVNPDQEVLASAQNALLYNTYVAMARGQQKLLATAISAAP